MENLPAEILENVFHALSKKEDIEICSKVNSKWRNVISSSMNISFLKGVCSPMIGKKLKTNIYLQWTLTICHAPFISILIYSK